MSHNYVLQFSHKIESLFPNKGESHASCGMYASRCNADVTWMLMAWSMDTWPASLPEAWLESWTAQSEEWSQLAADMRQNTYWQQMRFQGTWYSNAVHAEQHSPYTKSVDNHNLCNEIDKTHIAWAMSRVFVSPSRMKQTCWQKITLCSEWWRKIK